MKKLLGALVVLAAAVSTPARADEGFSLGLRAGYGVPFGSTTGAAGDDFNKLLSGSVPIWVDAGYRFAAGAGTVFVGPYFQYGFASAGDGANQLFADSSGTDVRLGAQVNYNFATQASVMPWAGFGLGYEWATVRGKEQVTGFALDADAGAHGWEVVFQGGGDFMASPNVTVGPFLAVTLARFQTMTASALGQSQSMSISDVTDTAMHGWLQFGLKGTFNL